MTFCNTPQNTARFAAALAGAALLLTCAGRSAWAVAPRRAHVAPFATGLQRARGPAVRSARISDADRLPRAAVAAWRTFIDDVALLGGNTAAASWRATWDRATGVPTRLYGAGLWVPGSMNSPAVAEAYARAFLARHIELLAPGARESDFELASNQLHAGIRSVGFFQYRGGVRVLGGQISFRFKNDRLFMLGSEALPRVPAPLITRSLDSTRRARFIETATRWLLTDAAGQVATASAVAPVEGPFVLPLVGAKGVLGYRTVVRVNLAARAPVGRWEVYVDATTGDVVAREQTLLFASGTLSYDAPVRRPTGERAEYAADFANIVVNGNSFTTADQGVVNWEGDGPANVTTSVSGPLIRVENDTGDDPANETITIQPDERAVWSAAEQELIDAQITVLIHGNRVKRYCMGITPDMDWLNEQIRGTVNIDDNCNAYSDGTNINFFTSGGGCENTGRLPDVIYHEFGHSYHAHSIIPGVGSFDGALSEGVSDYLAATITNDHGMGRGFFLTDQPLRDLDPATDLVFPDDLQGEVHADGEIIAGALWDMRKALIEKHGEEVGVRLSDSLYQAGIARAVDMQTMYVEVLAADDDDGDLSNGTPNECELNGAFERHGLRNITATVTPLGAEVRRANGFEVGVEFSGLSARCGGEAVTAGVLEWNLRADPSVNGTEEMAVTGANTLTGAIPSTPADGVIQYRVRVTFADGKVNQLPQNPADPLYEFFVGEVEPIYCTDFETDPVAEGWTHGLASGEDTEGADDWQWDEPAGAGGSGDPGEAFSGDRVFGNDLGHDNYNGSYQAEKVNYAASPLINVGAYSEVRLQYWRWLNVEDAKYDQASIYANDELVWRNLATDGGVTQHQDREWRFHDVDLGGQVNAKGSVQIKFELASDGGLEMGGWTIDDFCIVGLRGSICGDGAITGNESCDQGEDNRDAPDACRTNCQLPVCGDGIVDSGEQCDDGNDDDSDDCTSSCARPAGFDDGGGDCGCVAGDARRGPAPLGGLLLLSLFAGLAAVGRRRHPRHRARM